MANQTSVQLSPVMNTYARFPITLVEGKGSYVWSDEGKKYLDFTSGIAVCNLGHAPQAVKSAIEEQLQKLWHCSNLYHIPAQTELAELLVQHSCLDSVFFCNSGAEANEAAIKLARRYANKVKKTGRTEIVTFKQSFHGRTMAALSATGQDKIQDGFSPLLPGFHYFPFNDSEALEQIERLEPCAVMLELIQGEGGVIRAEKEWVSSLSQLCKKKGILLIVDEIQTGMGRTGKLFAYEHYDIEPDVITLAKGLGSGFPIGAMMAKGEAAQAFEPGSHGSTFGGNPLAATAGLATMKEVLSGPLNNAEELGAYLHEKLTQLKDKYSSIKEVRGIGLMAGLEVRGNGIDIVKKAQQQQMLILTAGQNVVRILPPLTATKQEIDEFIETMEKVLRED